MKKSYLFLVLSLLLFSCSSADEFSQDLPETKATGWTIGIGYLRSTSGVGGSATVDGVTVKTEVPHQTRVTVQATPNAAHYLDYWWQYTSQPSFLPGATPPANRVRVHTGQTQFTHTATAEAWFEPVFASNTVTFTLYNYVGILDFNNKSYVTYYDASGVQQRVDLGSTLTHTFRVKRETQLVVYIDVWLKIFGDDTLYLKYTDSQGANNSYYDPIYVTMPQTYRSVLSNIQATIQAELYPF